MQVLIEETRMEHTWTIQVKLWVAGYELPKVYSTAALVMAVVVGVALGLIYGGM